MGCEIAWGEGEGCGEEGMVGMAVRLVVVPWGFECRDEQTEFIADKVGTLNGFLPRCIAEEALIQWNPFLGGASNMCSIASIDYRHCSRIRMSQLNQNQSLESWNLYEFVLRLIRSRHVLLLSSKQAASRFSVAHFMTRAHAPVLVLSEALAFLHCRL